jgi:protocatechuate 3,4-dioxygenase beta subunit
VDAAGTPIRGATVRALHYAGGWEWLENSTEEDGRFSFDIGGRKKCTVEARHASYATTVVEYADPGIRLVLVPGVPVRVEVRGGGKPIAGARVAAPERDAMLLAYPEYRAIAESTTDGRGVAEFHVPPGRFAIWAGAAGWAPKLAPPIVCAIGEPQEVRIELEAGGFVEGTVRDSRGLGVPGARVVVQAHPGFRGATATGSDGSYVLEHVPLVSGPSLLVVTDHPDHAATSEFRMWNPADGERMRFDLVFPETSGLNGVALGSSGEPLSGRRIVVSYQGGFHVLYSYAWMSDRYPFAGTTDARGRFEMKGLPPGKATLYLLPDPRDRMEVELAPGQTLGPVEFRLTGIALRGRVLDADGNPVAKASIYPGDVVTDAEGRFALRTRPDEIVVQAEGHVPVLRPIDGEEIEIRLSAIAVEGSVIDPAGDGNAGIEVSLTTQLGRSVHATEARTDERGRFRFRGAGETKHALFTLDVDAPGRELVGGRRSVWGPQEGIVLVLAAVDEAERRRVRGTVVDEAGRPIDATVSYTPVPTQTQVFTARWAAQRAGQPGSFVCEELEPLGEMKIVFNAPGYLNSEPIAVVFDGRTPVEPIKVRLRRGTEVEVTVCEEDGTPVPGAFVSGYAANSVNGCTDADGRCVLSGLPPGRNRITASHRYLTQVNEAYVEATAGARQRVEFRGKPAASIVVRIAAEQRAKTCLVLRLLDSRGAVVSEDRIEKARLQQMEQMFPGARWDQGFAVTANGTYRIRCEIDGVALPEAEVEARLRETVEVDLKPAR